MTTRSLLTQSCGPSATPTLSPAWPDLENRQKLLQEFRDAGYHAYSIEVSLRDGARAIAVFLGPYAELAPAERDLERARQIPGYDSGRLVQVGPPALPAASPP